MFYAVLFKHKDSVLAVFPQYDTTDDYKSN